MPLNNSKLSNSKLIPAAIYFVLAQDWMDQLKAASYHSAVLLQGSPTENALWCEGRSNKEPASGVCKSCLRERRNIAQNASSFGGEEQQLLS